MKVRGRSLEPATWQASRSNGTLAEKVRENVGRENTEVAMKRAKGPTYVCSSEVVLHWEEAMIE